MADQTKPAFPAKRPDRPEAEDADVEARILAAARRVFSQHGTAGARMQQIASEAGVNQALIHYYFRTKEHLADRVFHDAVARLVQGLAPALAVERSIDELVTRFVHGYIDAIGDSPFLPTYVLSESYHHPERLNALVERAVGTVPAEVGRRVLARLTELVDTAVSTGAMRPISPRQFMVHVLGLVVFPFAGRPVLMPLLDMRESDFAAFIAERRAELPSFILNAIRP